MSLITVLVVLGSWNYYKHSGLDSFELAEISDIGRTSKGWHRIYYHFYYNNEKYEGIFKSVKKLPSRIRIGDSITVAYDKKNPEYSILMLNTEVEKSDIKELNNCCKPRDFLTLFDIANQ